MQGKNTQPWLYLNIPSGYYETQPIKNALHYEQDSPFEFIIHSCPNVNKSGVVENVGALEPDRNGF